MWENWDSAQINVFPKDWPLLAQNKPLNMAFNNIINTNPSFKSQSGLYTPRIAINKCMGWLYSAHKKKTYVRKTESERALLHRITIGSDNILTQLDFLRARNVYIWVWYTDGRIIDDMNYNNTIKSGKYHDNLKRNKNHLRIMDTTRSRVLKPSKLALNTHSMTMFTT